MDVEIIKEITVTNIAAAAAVSSASNADLCPSSLPPHSGCPWILLVQQPAMQSRSSMPSSLGAQHTIGSGYDIICASGWASPVWHALILAGARAIGLRDKAYMDRERGAESAILDWGDTLAGQLYQQQQAAVSLWHHARTPTSKRVHYAAMHSPHPFSVPYAALAHTGRVVEERVHRWEDRILSMRDWQQLWPFFMREPQHGQQSKRVIVHEYAANKKPKLDAAGNNKKEQTEAVTSASSMIQDRRITAETEPPYDVLAVPTQLDALHIPLLIVRRWKEEWRRAEEKGNCSLPTFLRGLVGYSPCLFRVRVMCMAQGHPSDMAMICMPVDKEVASWMQMYEQQNAGQKQEWAALVDEPYHEKKRAVCIITCDTAFKCIHPLFFI